jgi:hypothetical protein
MKKRSAILTAIGVAAALVLGSVAMSTGVLTTSSADAQTRPTPHVRTIHRTVKVHRTADGGPGRSITVSTSGSSGSPSEGSSGPSGDDPFEDEDEHEHEVEFEGAEHQGGDHAGSGAGSGEDSGDD